MDLFTSFSSRSLNPALLDQSGVVFLVPRADPTTNGPGEAVQAGPGTVMEGHLQEGPGAEAGAGGPGRGSRRAQHAGTLPGPSGSRALPGPDSTFRLSEPASQESAPFLGQIKDIQSRLKCLDFWIYFGFCSPYFLLQSN